MLLDWLNICHYVASDSTEDAIARARITPQALKAGDDDYYFASYSHYGIHEDMLKVCDLGLK